MQVAELPGPRSDGFTLLGSWRASVTALAVGPGGVIVSSHRDELVRWGPDGGEVVLHGSDIRSLSGNAERWVGLERGGEVLELHADGSHQRWFALDEPWVLALHPNGDLYVAGGCFNNVLTFDRERKLVGALSIEKYVMGIHPSVDARTVTVVEWVFGPAIVDAHCPPTEEDGEVRYDGCHSGGHHERADVPYVGFIIDSVPLSEQAWLVATDAHHGGNLTDEDGLGLWLFGDDIRVAWRTGMITKLAQRGGRVIAGSLEGVVYLIERGRVVSAWQLPEGKGQGSPMREALSCDTYDWKRNSVGDLAFRGDDEIIAGTAGGDIFSIRLS